MSRPTVPKPSGPGKPEPPPIVTLLRRLQGTIAEHDRLAADRLAAMFRTWEGRG